MNICLKIYKLNENAYNFSFLFIYIYLIYFHKYVLCVLPWDCTGLMEYISVLPL